jgi:4'-phosphopantetheinyl transferase
MISTLMERFGVSMRPVPSSLSADDVHVWCADSREPWPEAVLSGLLSEHERNRAENFVFEEDRRQYVHAHGLLRMLLGGYLGRAPGSIRLTTEGNGKPCLPLEERAVHFNISHARALVLCALARNRHVGVDVEWRDRDFFSWRDVAAYTCSEREQAVLSSLAGPAQADTFFSWWTLKEACVKALGAGMELPLNRIDVADEARTESLSSAPGDIRDRDWAMFTLPMASEYAGALVTEGRPARVRCFHWTWDSETVSILRSERNRGEVEEHHHAHQA